MVAKATVIAGALLAALVVLPSARSAPTSPYAWAAALPGCAASRPAVAHHGSQQVLSPQPTNGPVPCGVLTGWPAVENRIEVTNNGTVVYMPALLAGTDPAVDGGCGHMPGVCVGNNVARTTDGGATWSVAHAEAFPESKVFAGDVDNNLYVDHGTGRFFYYDYDSGTEGAPGVCGQGQGATIFFSDDNGRTWDHGFDFEHNCSENPTILVAKARTSKPSYAGGVVYLCGNNFGTGIAGTGSTGKICSKSLDGGRTWLAKATQGGTQGEYSGQVKDQSSDPYPQCQGASSSAPHDVQPLPDGSLVVVVTCGSATFLTRSVDEGATWKIQNPVPSAGSLRSDSKGNLYKLRETFLSTSTDGGRTWSKEHDLLAPGVVSRGTTFFAQGTHAASHQVGDVAVMYYGVRKGETASDGFITETRNALDPNPVFWSGQVNSPDRPLLYNTPGANMGVTVLDFIGGAFSPDGRSVWASFVRDCGTNPVTDPNCTKRYPVTNPLDPQDGFAGRLVWPSQVPVRR